MSFAALRLPLYVRIWLAVVLAVVLATVLAGSWLRYNAGPPPTREVVIRDEAGEVIGQVQGRPIRIPGQGAELPVQMRDGTTLYLHFPPRARHAGEPPPPRPWARGMESQWLMLAIVALAVAAGAYPVVRRLTQRLEALNQGVQRWGEGDLSARVAASGDDEVGALAERFNEAADRVEGLVRSHKSLLANASHELRSPLARIRMGLELMDPPPGARARQEITRDINELDQLIDEILLASRLDARESEVGVLEPVDLTGLTAEECARVGADFTPMTGSEPVMVMGVPKLLRRAVRNLLENARRYSQGDIDVQLLSDPTASLPTALVRVCDQGPGVPSAQRERIFEPFYRLPGASERAGGVGLGLALVRSIAARHHGTVRCEDHPPPGACFALRIPRLRQP